MHCGIFVGILVVDIYFLLMYLRLLYGHSVDVDVVGVIVADDGGGERSFYDVTFIDCGSHHDEFVSPLS